jgi:D-proline reductase (dithiol) PrdB
MARLEDIPPGTREAVAGLECAGFADTPWVGAAPLARRTIAILTSAALHPRAQPPFAPGSAEVRELRADLPAADIVMSHVSINYDRSGFSRDINIAYPIDRLRELAAEGIIGRVAPVHFSVMGSTDPATMGATVDTIAARCKEEGIDAILLCPV